MSKVTKLISKNANDLLLSQKRMADLYNIIFSYDGIMSEFYCDDKKTTQTYKDTAKLIDLLAIKIAQVTNQTDRYIGLYATNSPKWIIIFWAILKSGNKPYLINMRQPEGATKNCLDILNTFCIISHSATPCDLGIKNYSYEYLMGLPTDDKEIPSLPFADEFALSTSGTSLNQKICFYSGEEICAQILNVGSIAKINPEIIKSKSGKIKMLAFLPFYHVFGLTAVYLWYAFFGATFVFLKDTKPETILKTIRDHKVTHIFAVPLLWHGIENKISSTLKELGAKKQKKFLFALNVSLALQGISSKIGKLYAKIVFKNVRQKLLGNSAIFLISGGSAIRQSASKLINGLGYTLANGYGMSEIGITSVDLSKNIKVRTLCSIGKPFDSVKYKITDSGELMVCGNSVCKKIIINGEETIPETWFNTGDIAQMDKNGNYFIGGRTSEIVCGDDGENLNPDFAENLFSLPHALSLSVLGNAQHTKLMLVVQIPKELTPNQKQDLNQAISTANQKLSGPYRIKNIYFTFDSIMQPNAIKVSRAFLEKEIESGRVKLFENL